MSDQDMSDRRGPGVMIETAYAARGPAVTWQGAR
jgi:hypothetical protein